MTDLDRQLCFLYTHAQLAHDIRNFGHEIPVSIILITLFSGNNQISEIFFLRLIVITELSGLNSG